MDFESFKKFNQKPEFEPIEIGEKELPESVREALGEIMSTPQYMSADADGLLRILGYKKVELGDGKVNYLISGELTKYAKYYIGDQPVEIIIETQDNKVVKSELKEIENFVAA